MIFRFNSLSSGGYTRVSVYAANGTLSKRVSLLGDLMMEDAHWGEFRKCLKGSGSVGVQILTGSAPAPAASVDFPEDYEV